MSQGNQYATRSWKDPIYQLAFDHMFFLIINVKTMLQVLNNDQQWLSQVGSNWMLEAARGVVLFLEQPTNVVLEG